MRDYIPQKEEQFLSLFQEFFDSEKDTARQHDPANYSLERMHPLAEAAGNPEDSLKIIHIAGTKGKGTTCLFLSSLLASCNAPTGLFTSPHVATVRERFQINNQLVPYETLLNTAYGLLDVVRKRQLHPSIFEIFTILALRLFADSGMEYAILETGLGGRLDATNFISKPCLCILAPISFDHTALLGNTIEQIASEKAGILKPGIPVVIAKQPFQQALETLQKAAGKSNSPILPPAPLEQASPFLPHVFPEFLRDNFATALAAMHCLGFRPQPEAFHLPALRARFELVSRNPPVLLDGAHNADSMQKLVASLENIYPDLKWTVILGSVQGKDIHGIVSALKQLDGADFILTNPRSSKASALPQLKAEAEKQKLSILKVLPDIPSLDLLPSHVPLLFTGSFFTAAIGEALFHPNPD